MSEQYDFEHERNGWFQHLLLGSGDAGVLTKHEDFDSSKMTVELKINGIELFIGSFNEVLDVWSDRIESRIKEEMGFLEADNAVVAKAEELLKKKIGNVYDKLSELENESWRLYEDD